MKKICRILLCSLLNHESLFDLDYENAYSIEAPKEFFQALSVTKHSTPPVFCEKNRIFCHKSHDEVLLILIAENDGDFRASDQIAMIQFTNRLMKVCKDFLGKLTVANILSNITLFAEIIDCMLIAGFVHLTDTSKIRGFLSHNYVESKPASAFRQSAGHSLNSASFDKLSGAGYQPSNQAKVVQVSQSIMTPSTEDIYVDMIETLDFNINKTGETTCFVKGLLTVSNVSSGQKIINFQLNKAYSKMIGQQSFNTIVNSQQFTTQGLLQASVPLGQSQLMSYQLTSDLLPFTIDATNGSRAGELSVTLHCAAPASIMCLKVIVSLRLAEKSRGLLPLTKLPKQSLDLQEDKQTIDWNIPEIAGQTYSTIHFKVLAADHGDYSTFNQLNASLQFEISNYLHSGCKLQSVKVDHSKSVKKWIRHLTVSGECKSEMIVK